MPRNVVEEIYEVLGNENAIVNYIIKFSLVYIYALMMDVVRKAYANIFIFLNECFF